MYEEVIEKILESLDENLITAGYAKFSGDGYNPLKIYAKNFHKISKNESNKKMAFVDGGNADIISSANFSLSLIRAGVAIYLNNKKISTKKFEVFAFVKATSKNDEIHYTASFFMTKNHIKLEEMSFSSFDYTLMSGINRADIRSVSNALRRFAELKLAKIIADEKAADVIILDGNLQCTLTNENNYLTELYESCSKNNVILAALGKTNSLFTDDGNLLSIVLGNISNLPIWFYYPIVEINNANHKAEVFFVKLHPKSNHIFRFEIFNRQKGMADETINELASNCIDPIFIGYPYGLIEADRIARISNHEKDSLKTMFLAKLRNSNIEKYLSSVNAHEILDRISF